MGTHHTTDFARVVSASSSGGASDRAVTSINLKVIFTFTLGRLSVMTVKGAALCTLCLLNVVCLAADVAEEKLRAAVVLGVLKFTEFPPETLSNDNFIICLIGQPHSSNALLSLPDTLKLYNKPVNVISGRNLRSFKRCDVAIIGRNLPAESGLSVSAPKGPLVICDDCTKQHSKLAAIQTYRSDTKIRFSVNLKNSEPKKVRFNSSLLELAERVVMP